MTTAMRARTNAATLSTSSHRMQVTLPCAPAGGAWNRPAGRLDTPKRHKQGSLIRVIDLKALREDPDTARASQTARGEDPGLVDALLAADERRRTTLREFESLRAEQNTASRAIGKASPEERPALLENAKALTAQVKAAEAAAG